MTDFFYLVPIALLLGLAGLGAFMWALRSGQYDDLDGAAHRILFDDDSAPVLNSKPWPGAEITVSFPYAGQAHIDSEGYFKVFLEPDQMTALKKRKPSKNIYTPTQEQGSSRANDEFPPRLLSQNKSEAGVVKIAKPAYLK